MHARHLSGLLSFSLLALPLSGCGTITADEPGGPRFVAVGVEGTIVTSPDGKAFTAQSPTDVDLTSVVYGAGVFVAVGEGGMIFTSETGLDFAQRYSPTDVDLAHVIYTGERFVAVGGDFEVGSVTVASADGLTWERLLSPGTHMFHAVAHRGDVLIAAAYLRSDLQTPALFTAEPGKDWQEGVGPDFYDSLSSDDGTYTVGGSSVHHFVDGLGWTSTSLPGAMGVHSITHDDSMFVVVGEQGAVFSSPDGEAWTDQSLSGETGWFGGVCHGGTTFVAVGSDGRIMTSADGAAWSAISSPTKKTLLDVAYTPGQDG
jgi:hypothetical protein